MFNNSTAAFSNRTRGSQQLKTVIWNMGFQIFFPDQGNISFQIKEIFLSRSRKYSSPGQENITFQIKGIFFSRSRKYFFPDQGHIKIKLNEAWAASPPPLAAGDGSTSDEIWLNWISNCHPFLKSSVKAMEWLYFKIVIFVCCTMRFQTRNKLFMKTKVLFNIKTAPRLLLKRFK